ncbi:TPA: hypothetical protein ACH3X2_012726 [Trebouxia sp. C0005]|nr:MAG: sodium hydrogen exchanger [Trebouxia sp. A1-2]
MAIWTELGAVAMCLPAWFLAGRLAQQVKLPLITGYLVAGALSGPSLLQLFRSNGLASLSFVDHACLSVIALAAGAELRVSELKKTKRQVICITLGISLLSWLCVFVAMMMLVPFIPFTQHRTHQQQQAVASLAGTLAIARSPASAIAVLRETDARGPFCSTVMAVVVVKDVLLFVCLAMNLEFANMAMVAAPQGFNISHMLQPALSVTVSIGLGALGGTALGMLLNAKPTTMPRTVAALTQVLPQAVIASWKPAAVLLAASTIFFTAVSFTAEPLLACVVAGLMTTNRKSVKNAHEQLTGCLSQLMPFVYVAFFGLAGASLKLGSFVGSLWVAVILCLVRLAGIWGGCWLGCWLGATPVDHRKHMWYGMITQAGVAMGLAKTVAVRFPEWGPDFATLMTCAITMNMMAGPPLFKRAIVQTGEARAMLHPALSQELEEAIDKSDKQEDKQRQLLRTISDSPSRPLPPIRRNEEAHLPVSSGPLEATGAGMV